MKKSIEALAGGQIDAVEHGIDAIVNCAAADGFEVSRDDATRVLATYRKHKLATIDPIMRVTNFRHGGLLDGSVIAAVLADNPA